MEMWRACRDLELYETSLGNGKRSPCRTNDVGSVRLPELAVGLFIVAASIAGAILWQRSVENGTAVLVTARDLSRGDVVDESDLDRVVLTTTGDIALIRATSVDQVVGRRVTADLMRGTPLAPDFLVSTRALGVLDGLAGLTVAPSSAPAELAAGDAVRVFVMRSNVEGDTVVEEVTGPIEVWEVSMPDPSSNERAVTVRCPLASIPSIVGAVQIHLVKVVE